MVKRRVNPSDSDRESTPAADLLEEAAKPRRWLTRPGVLFLLAVGVAGVVLLAADWWVALPEGSVGEYTPRADCIDCHQEQVDLWAGSDHDLAMDLPTAETVLGDFDDKQFVHVAFEDLDEFTDDHLGVLLERLESAAGSPSAAESEWLLALHEADGKLKDHILGRMPGATSARIEDKLRDLQAVRPADVAGARDRIIEVARRLVLDGTLKADFAVRSRFFRDAAEEKYFVTTDAADGTMQTFEIKYVFGVRPLQQYLIELPGGRKQCLGIAWDTEQRRWYHLYPSERIPAGDELHWTRPLQNWNYMCAECHSTNLEKNFDVAKNEYHTTFTEIDVSCQACHGPGSLHNQLAESNGIFKWDRRLGYALANLKDDNSHVEIETCAPCHARRRVVYPGFEAGEKFLDHYVPELLDTPFYYADGQILEEDYVYGSFIQSKMYAKGVRCSDCHDPHTARVKYVDPEGPRDKIPNKVCTNCHMDRHPAGEYDTPLHHFHPDSSQPGTQCVDCHMAETPYMVVDPRRDHSMRIPRPDLTMWLDVPNACNGCHHDESKGETPEWAEAKLEEWYGERKEPNHFAYAIAAGREARPEGQSMLDAVARRDDLTAAIRASALLLLARYQTDVPLPAVRRGLEDTEALVRLAAVRSFQDLDAEDPADREVFAERLADYLVPMLDDPIRAVRVEAARILSRVAHRELAGEDLAAFRAALEEFMTGQKHLGDQGGAHLNMAVVHENLGDRDKAIEEYLTAIRIDPHFVQARNNLAMLYNADGDRAADDGQPEVAREKKAEAEKQLRKIIELRPEWGEIHYSLGLLLAEDETRLADAAESLATAAEMLPENPRIHYNCGLAMQRLGRAEEAERELLAADRTSGGRNPDILYAVIVFYMQQRRWDKAVSYAEEFQQRWPGSPQAAGILERVKQEAEADRTGGGPSDSGGA